MDVKVSKLKESRFGGFRGEFSLPSHLLEATCIPWLMASCSIFKCIPAASVSVITWSFLLTLTASLIPLIRIFLIVLSPSE